MPFHLLLKKQVISVFFFNIHFTEIHIKVARHKSCRTGLGNFLKTISTLSFFIASTGSAEPTLLIPSGTYLQDVDLSTLYISQGNLHVTYASPPIRSDTLRNFRRPWSGGEDIIIEDSMTGHPKITTQIRPRQSPMNMADFLYITLPSAGSYLNDCRGILKTMENNREYLYATCSENGGHSTPAHSQKFDITDCEAGTIKSNQGILGCREGAATTREILDGSFLESDCDIADTFYHKDTGILQTVCEKSRKTLSNADNCIGSGFDIIYRDNELECIERESASVTIQRSSLYLPAGNYMLSCRGPAFYPCLGSNQQGLLVAKCRTSTSLREVYNSVTLENADDACNMAQRGFVSNINGVLVCDPDVEFTLSLIPDNDFSGSGDVMMDSLQCSNQLPL